MYLVAGGSGSLLRQPASEAQGTRWSNRILYEILSWKSRAGVISGVKSICMLSLAGGWNETTILPKGGLRLRLSLVLVHVDGGPCRCILAPSSRRQRESTLQRRLSNAIKVSSFNHSPLLSNVEDRFGNLEYGFCVSSVAGYRQISPRVKSYYTLSSLQRHFRSSGISAKTVDDEWRSWHRCVVSTLPRRPFTNESSFFADYLDRRRESPVNPFSIPSYFVPNFPRDSCVRDIFRL